MPFDTRPMSDSTLGIILAVAAIVVTVVFGLPPFLQSVQAIVRWQRRRDPLRIEVSPHRLDDRILVTVKNRGDQVLTLAWGALRTSAGPEPLLPSECDIFGAKVEPISQSDGYVFPLLREWMPVTDFSWTGIHIFDQTGHHRFERIPPGLSARIERPSSAQNGPPSPPTD